MGAALFGIRSVAASRGKAEQKLRGRCPDGEERKVLGAPHGASKADLFPKCYWAGVCRDSPCPAVHPLCPARPRPPALLLACYLGRQLHPPELSAFFQQGLTQPQLLFGACSGALLRLVTVWGIPASHEPGKGSARVANGPLRLRAAGLDSGPRQDRGTKLQLAGGCEG